MGNEAASREFRETQTTASKELKCIVYDDGRGNIKRITRESRSRTKSIKINLYIADDIGRLNAESTIQNYTMISIEPAIIRLSPR